jgi:DNA-binding MarR family transcriptional regulator
MTGPADPAAFRFFNEIGIIEQLARNVFERVLPDGLKVSQFALLNHFVRLGDDKNPADLARAFQVTKGAMTNTLQRLEARGLVTVGPDPDDGRGKRVHITEAGRRVRDRSIAALGPALAVLEREFGEAAFADALPFLERLRASLDAARDGSD